MKITFYFKKSQGNLKAAKGFGIVHFYTYENNTKHLEMSTSINCHYSEFDAESQCFTGKFAIQKNRRMDEIRQLFEIIIGSKKSITQADLVEFSEKVKAKGSDIIVLKKFTDVIEEWLALQKKKIRKEGEKRHVGNIENSTYKTYLKRYDNIYDFLRSRNLLEINVSKFDEALCQQFDIWSTSTVGLIGKRRGQNYTTKHLKLIRTVMEYARRNKYISVNQTLDYKLIYEPEKPVETISNIDIKKLEEYKGFNEIEQKYVDAFLFMRECFLHFGDYYELQNENLDIDEKGKKWIVKDRTKRVVDDHTVQVVPLSERAEEILQKYGGQLSNLPRARNSVMAKYLKIACVKAGISQNIKIKFGRSNGISNAYNINKARGEQIAIVAGWSTTRQLKRYLKVDFSELRKEILNIA